MSWELRQRLYRELSSWPLIDPHTHINAHQPAAKNLAEILGYHYYTELAHSAGMPRATIEEEGLDPKERVRRLVEHLRPLENTIQSSWLIEMAQEFFDFQDDVLTAENWEPLYDHSRRRMAADDWAAQVLAQSGLKAVFLTNDFDDPLEGFDTRTYIPCLRTDELVFHFDNPAVQRRLEEFTGTDGGTAAGMRAAIGELMQHFVRHGARACAISLPPDFRPEPVADSDADAALRGLRRGTDASEDERRTVRALRVLDVGAGLCRVEAPV